MGENFHDVVDSKDFSVVNHNARNFDAFRNFQEDLDKKFQTIEDRRAKEERLGNVRKWEEHLPKRWSGAKLSDMSKESSRKAKHILDREEALCSFYVKGNPGVGKTYLSFAIVRECISLGLVTPSQVKVISEESLLSILKMGFSGAERFDKFFSSNIALYFFDNVGMRKNYTVQETSMWEQLIDHIYSKNLSAIFTSTTSAREFSDMLTSPAASKFGYLVDNHILVVDGESHEPELDGYTDDEMNNHEKENRRIDGILSFGD